MLAGRLESPVRAVDLHDVLADYAITSWTQRDGLPGAVWAIAQDADNYLWLGTDEGVLRFDGVRFLPPFPTGSPPMPTRSVRALWAARDGSLWVGYESGSVVRVRGSQFREFAEADGFPSSYVAAFAEDRTNTLWAATAAGLFRFDGSKWHRVSGANGLPAAAAFTVFVDDAGTLFVAASTGMFRRLEGTARFEAIDADTDVVRDVSMDADGALWATDPILGFTRVAPGVQSHGHAGRGARLLHDTRGDLWVGTLGQGLWRVRRGDVAERRPVVERATILTGLSSDTVRTLFEDREGNVWAGTAEGLNRLTPHKVTPVTTLGMVTALDITRDGRVWVATADVVMRFSETNGWWETAGAEWPVAGTRALHVAEDGTTWIGANNELLRMDRERPVRVQLPRRNAPTRIDIIESDPAGRVWLIDRVRGVFRWDGTELLTYSLAPVSPPAWVTGAYSDRGGNLWLAFSGSRLGRLEADGSFKVFGPEDGLAAGPYNAIFEDGNRIVWIGSGDGLSRFADGRFSSVTRANGFPIDAVGAIVEDDERHLWLGTATGIVRLSRSEFEAAIADPSHRVRYRIFDTSDGAAGMPVTISSRSAVRASDGRLWFATGRGLTVVDPRIADARRTPAVVRIESAAADHQQFDPSAIDRLPRGTERLEIEYSSLSLTAPFKTRFRYRLEGFDADWIDAGTRRQAIYTNLPARDYRFRVAAVDDDSGREHEAVWAFALPPRYYETAWFYALAIAVGVAVIAGAWQWRLRQIRRQFALVLGERVRVSRELHDTLLQSLVGVALQVDAVSHSLDRSKDEARAQLGRVRRQVEEYIREARESIWNLRTPMLNTRDLATALRESGERSTAGSPVAFAFAEEGTPRPCDPDVQHQLVRIGQEAVLNAVRHASANLVKVELQYGADALRLRVSDNGHGFDLAAATNGSQHYGLTTMRERAEEAGGQFCVHTAPGTGTVVEATMPYSSTK
jgi:signal transduction histidine kinase